MSKRAMSVAAAMVAVLAGTAGAVLSQKWEVHDMNRPMSPVITPGNHSREAPSDAIVLFDGKDLSKWTKNDGSPSGWKVEGGYAEVNGTGSIRTKEKFGDVQLHLEFAEPAEVKGDSQHRGNSGVFFQGIYELQVLDCYNNKTYADGQTAAMYGQHPPLVNACRKPGEWQMYDIVYHRPVFQGEKLVTPGRITVLHNGVLVQDNQTFEGATAHGKRAEYRPHADELPLGLQDHGGDKVRFRNIWVRKLKPAEE